MCLKCRAVCASKGSRKSSQYEPVPMRYTKVVLDLRFNRRCRLLLQGVKLSRLVNLSHQGFGTRNEGQTVSPRPPPSPWSHRSISQQRFCPCLSPVTSLPAPSPHPVQKKARSSPTLPKGTAPSTTSIPLLRHEAGSSCKCKRNPTGFCRTNRVTTLSSKG